MTKKKMLNLYFPECEIEDIKYFKISWINTSIYNLEKIHKTKNNRLTKKHKEVLLKYISNNYKDMNSFSEKCQIAPIFNIVFKKYNPKLSLTLNNLFNIFFYFDSLESHCDLFLNTILTLRKAEQRKKFRILQDYLERKINDTIL